MLISTCQGSIVKNGKWRVSSHLEKTYSNKSDAAINWYQEVPGTSLQLIEKLNVEKSHPMYDVGNANLTLE